MEREKITSASNPESDQERLIPLSVDTEETKGCKTTRDRVRYLLQLLHRRRGILWALAAAIFTSVQVISFTTYSKQKTVWQGLLMRSIFLSCMIVKISWKENTPRSSLELILFVLGGILEVIAVVSLVLAGHFIWTGDASSISLNMPIPASLLAHILLREPIDVVDILLMVVNGIGLVFVSRPSFLFPHSPLPAVLGSSPTLGVLLSFVSLASSCSLSIICRFLLERKTDDTYLMVSLCGVAGIGISTLVSSITSSWEFPQEIEGWLLLSLIGASTLLTLCPYFKSLETEHVMSATIFLSLSIPLVCLYDFFILNRLMKWQEILGVMLILGSTFVLHGKNEVLGRYS